MLLKTSRTFALNIPLLPDGLRMQVGIAYLLFRIADSIEDGIPTKRSEKRRLFDLFIEAMRTGDAAEFCKQSLLTPPHESPDCCEVIQNTPMLLDELSKEPAVSDFVCNHVINSAEGMRRFSMAGGQHGNVRLKSRAELHDYCYVVAGIVGEMLTEMFLHHEPQLESARSELMELAPQFGEGLQLVNILKDSDEDRTDGRKFVPDLVPRQTLFAIARSNLRDAECYTEVLEEHQGSPGILHFTRLPTRLAKATLECVERNGPGSKISRDRVAHIVTSVTRPDSSASSTMKVLLAAPRGFCAGVRMAIDALDIAIDRLGTPLYVYHEIVHNRYVVENFTNRGAVFVNDLEAVPDGVNLIFSAHGVSPEIRSAAKQKNLRTIDATCPLVAKVHIEAARFAQQGYTIVLIGHEEHDEVVGIVGEAPNAIRVVSSTEEIDALDVDDESKLAWLTQTTLSVSDTAQLVDRLQKRFPSIVGPTTDDICYATQNRQSSLEALCDEADAVIVVGSQNSSNSQRLKELASEQKVTAWLVDSPDELARDDFEQVDVIAVTAGASAPDSAVEKVLDWLAINFGATVELRTHTSEDRVFPLPVELTAKAVQ